MDGLWFQTLTNLAPAAGNQLGVQLGGRTVFYTVPPGATLAGVANGLTAASHAYTHTNAAFNGPTLIGADSLNVGTGAGNREYSGVLDDVAIFNQTLSQGQLVSLYTNASQGSATACTTLRTLRGKAMGRPESPLPLTVV